MSFISVDVKSQSEPSILFSDMITDKKRKRAKQRVNSLIYVYKNQPRAEACRARGEL